MSDSCIIKEDPGKYNKYTIEECNENVDWTFVPEKNGCIDSKVWSKSKSSSCIDKLFVLKEGIIDRFGDETGSYFSPIPLIDKKFTPYNYSSRSIPYIKQVSNCEKQYKITYNNNNNNNYHQYKVLKTFNVFRCVAAPIEKYDTNGGAIQYFLKYDDIFANFRIENMKDLIDGDYIKEISKKTNEFFGYPEFGVYGGKQKPTHRKKISKKRKNKSKRKTKKC